MKTQPSPRAWESDPFWKEVVTVLTGGKKLRSEHYLEKLSAEDLESLRLALSCSGTLAEQQKLCPPRRGGATDGAPPTISLLSEIGAAVRQVNVLRELQVQSAVEAAARGRCQELGLDPTLTNAVVRIVGEEALDQKVKHSVGNFAISAANVLLNAEAMRTKGKQEEVKIQLRKDKLKLDERHLAMLEKKAAQADSAKGILADKKLTEDQKRQRMLQLFGM